MMSLSGTIRLNYSRGRRVTDSVAGAEGRPLLKVLTTFRTRATTPWSHVPTRRLMRVYVWCK